ncbi:hypothetical protein AS189_11450 [Arthrobacter alpinus]|uniref:peptidylprolyl isomerase n=1 Tax=Arthrobacter alpinus TaxID=656366 RepID=A0A0S2LZW6_9MICC|nr:hypothetical protein AS189_11450 [Arthrobacter alpinus]
MRRLLALLLLPLLLIVTACSQEASSPGASDASTSSSVAIPPANAEVLASVKAVDQGKDKAPKVTFDKPLDIKAESMRVVTDGTGAQVKTGQTMEFRGINLDTKTGATLVENFSAATGETVQLNDVMKTQFPLVYSIFTNAKVGAYVAYANPAVAAVTGSTAAPAQDAQPATLSVFQITSVKDTPAPSKLMSAEETAALEKAGKLPTAKFDAKGVPTITIPKNDAPAGLTVQVLTEGTGVVLKDSDDITAFYTGWTWSDSKKFDSAYDRGEASAFNLKEVIEGWTKGLTGQKVGSTVLLSIPTDLAYGENAASKGKPAGPLVFVVKIESKK